MILQGGLLPTEVTATNAERRALTFAYRKDVMERINSFYKNNPEARQNALMKLDNSDIDHIVDLQLGGANVRSNLKSLDSSVNRSFGKQLELNGLYKDTPVTRIEIDYLK